MKDSKKLRLSNFTENIILVSIVFSVIPQFFIMSNYYNVLKLVLYVFFGISIIMILPNIKFKKKSFVWAYIRLIYFSIMCMFGFALISGTININVITEIFLPFIILLIGYYSNIDKYKEEKYIKIYIIIVCILALFIIFVYGEGFKVTKNYFFTSKNQVGPLIFGSTILCFINLINENNHKYNKNNIFYIIMIIITLSCGIVIRNRSSIIATIIVIGIYLSCKLRKKRTLKVHLMILVIIIFTFIILISGVNTPNILYEALFSNYDITDINSITAGRTDIYKESFEFLRMSPFFGEGIIESGIIGTPHNYLINKLVKFGILGMLPITILYICLWLLVIRAIIKGQEDKSIYLLLFMLIISIFEYTYPFGPLTSLVIVWFYLGQYIRKYNI